MLKKLLPLMLLTGTLTAAAFGLVNARDSRRAAGV